MKLYQFCGADYRNVSDFRFLTPTFRFPIPYYLIISNTTSLVRHMLVNSPPITGHHLVLLPNRRRVLLLWYLLRMLHFCNLRAEPFYTHLTIKRTSTSTGFQELPNFRHHAIYYA